MSFPIRDRMAGFPGDPAVLLTPVHRIERGDPYDLSSLTMSSHTGTHVDPPRHFVRGGAGIDRVDLEILNGPARVVRIPRTVGTIGAESVEGVPAGTERVLFRTENSARWPPSFSFFPDYVALDESAARALLDRGVRLVGVDSLSVERDSTGTFPVHHRLLGGGALVLEGLVLGEVPEGKYDLACLPLRIVDGDGGPARATLTPR
ncbi:MAG: cyclase family protein [Thermoplasmata archaeon]